MTVLINASPTNGLQMTSDGSGIVKLQSNSVTTNALAWVNFVGSTAVKNASYNVSSVTRSSTGTYAVNFSTAMTDANYAAVYTAAYAGTGSGPLTQIVSQTTSVLTVSVATTAAFIDPAINNVAIFGN